MTTSPIAELVALSLKKVTGRRTVREAVQAIQSGSLRMRSSAPFLGRNHCDPLTLAIKAMNSLIEFRIAASDDRVLVEVGLKGSETHVLPAENLFRNVCLAIHRVTYASMLSSRRGTIFRNLALCKASLYTIRNQWGLSPHEWRFMQRARLDLCSLPTRPHPGIVPGTCKFCHTAPECLYHILALCEENSALCTKRHDMVLLRLARAILSSYFLTDEENVRIQPLLSTDGSILRVREGVTLYINCRVPYSGNSLRPDILLEDLQKRMVWIVDVQVVSECTPFAFQMARERKIQTYSNIADNVKRKGLGVLLDAFLMGAFGSFDPANMKFINFINLPPEHLEHFQRFLCSQIIKSACDMYYSYINQ